MALVRSNLAASPCPERFCASHDFSGGLSPSQPVAMVRATLTCSFLAAARPPHDLFATATVIKPGKRIVYGEVSVTSNDRVVAHATLNFANLG